MSKASKSKTSTKAVTATKRFQARLERLRSRLNWVVVHLPFDAAAGWGLRGQIKVTGEINGFEFRTSLFPTRDGRHFLLVNKRMQKGAGAREGSMANFRLSLDTEARDVRPPDELKHILAEDRALQRWFGKLNHSTRADIAKWITDPANAATRVRRAEQMAERLLNIMDSERELPPVLKLAFARNPKASEGWEAMSLARRRGHLFGIFYYRTPDGQGRRIDKMLEDANAIAERQDMRKK